MDMALQSPDDPDECRRFLADLLRGHDAPRQRAEEEHQRAEDERQRAEDEHQRAEDERQKAEDTRRRFDELERILNATAADYDKLQQEHVELLETLAWLRRRLFGPRREPHVDDPNQGHLFDLPVDPESEPLATPPADADASPRTRPARTPRRTRYAHLPHIRIEHDLPDAEKTCSCRGTAKVRIGEDESPVLEYIPARLEVHVHILPKYACSKCRDGVTTRPVPPKPVPGGMAGPGLVSFVLVSKFSDHLTTYRLEDILTRHGVFLSRSTLCDWVRDAAIVLEPLAASQKTLVLQSPVIWTDDTPVTVLGGDPPGSATGRFWTHIGDDEHPYTVYDFTMSRSRDGPATFLSDDKGFLQADAYGGYDGIYLKSDGGILEVACWAHARRKFLEARSNAPREANQILEWIRQLYDIEDQARAATAEDRRELRQRESVPILDRIEKRLEELSEWALPKSALGKAVTYARNQWEA